MSNFDSSVPYHPVGTQNISVCTWLKHIKVYKIVLLVLLVLVTVPLIIHYYLISVSTYKLKSRSRKKQNEIIYSKVESDIQHNVHRSRSQLEAFEDFSSLKASDLKLRIDEMIRIKVSYK